MLDLQVAKDGDRGEIRLVGELDLAEATRFTLEVGRLMASDDVTRVVVDLRHLQFLDSSGLRAIIRADKRARGLGKSFALIPGADRVQRVFQLTRLDDRLEFLDPEVETS